MNPKAVVHKNSNMEKPSKNRLQKTPNECVQVVVRCRPMNEKEKIENHNVVSVYPMRGAVELTNINTDPNKENRKLFTYDAVYDINSTQKQIYDEVVLPLVSSVLEGFNCCIFAYGQTGTGKTHTMEGIANSSENIGIIPRTFEQIWSHINRTQNTNFLVAVSYLEIYMEELRDLLRPKKKNLELREKEKGGIYVPNLHSVSCQSVEDMKNVMNQGNKNRTVGYTNMNEHSSRSHAIFMIKIEMCEEESNTIKVGKLNLIDLAGSERQHKTGATAERLKEASKINLALSSLGNVISALSENSPHIPYRDSKLTRLLQDSLGGNSKTIMIANIGPSSFNYNETLTTLRYASRAKTIQNKPIKNEDPQDAQLREYQEEIERLRKLISERQKTEKTYSIKRVKSNKVKNEIEIENCENIEPDDNNIENTVSIDTEALERERDITSQLAVQLQELESQLVKGGKNILDTYTERQIELEKKLVEIAERKKREVEIQQQLELQEETTLEIRDTVTTLEQEVDIKTKKLSKCYAKYLALQQELNDTKNEHNYDLRELEVTQNELVKELKRLLLIIDNFVPVEIKSRLYTQARYDEEEEEWKISPTILNDITLKRPISCSTRRRPMSEYSLQESKRSNSNSYRHLGENIVNYELDMPCRTTYEYRRPKISASLQAVLAEAMQTDDDIDIIDASGGNQTKLDRILNTNSQQYGNNSNTINSRNINSSTPEGRSNNNIKKPVSAYPKSRGLVKK
ncbi:kinesin-like protein Klp68D [Condylostylus longicornis]|uniref:kinesin-like protein Klp68D n=1 Tax=Condylostylus longicornis TaxID=2530218 RepID=UPI00244E4C70|nr:kinesin-like protein Klp68D [Condylostylus longicornis]XP_055379322.1 kinesin-like protein Klp68D [Condylostylus longicornis]XP_055379323.1 kinesin-like protein Klp68D [Condylostylus longicornis]